jgi:hypothetical protein
MRPVLILGLLLMALATIAFVIGDFPVTSSTKVVDTGSVQATAKQERIVRVPVAVDAVFFLGGLAMVVLGARPRQEA